MGPGRVPKVPAARAQITLCGPQPLAGSGTPACRRFYARVVTMDRPRPVTTSAATATPFRKIIPSRRARTAATSVWVCLRRHRLQSKR